MSIDGFDALAKLAYDEAGLVLVPSKSAMIQSRLRHRMNKLGVSDLASYCRFVSGPDGADEKPLMIAALTTNVSSFFREKHHFDLVSPTRMDLMLDRLKRGERVRLWSAGCSNGQEPYSLAMHLLEYSTKFANTNCKILATDIDTNVLSFAKAGRYQPHQIENLSPVRLKRFFQKDGQPDTQAKSHIVPEVKKMVSFKRLNLHSPWPITGPFEVIFCRNVVIYFDTLLQTKLWPKFHSVLRDDGIICVGHSERISSELFKSIGATSYAKLAVVYPDHSKIAERSA